jgi:hypothetical protein
MDAGAVPAALSRDELSTDGEILWLQARSADLKSELNTIEDRLARLNTHSRQPDSGKADG